MKILHTADWHIGKQLYKHSLHQDMDLFFSELMSIIDNRSIDILLIAGDIFDLANPSNKDKEIYFSFLSQLMYKKIQVVITSGNHDSAKMLDGPKELIKNLNIHVVGEAISYENQIIPLGKLDSYEPEVIIAAVPFLREKDIRKSVSGESHDEKIEATRKGIVNHYQQIYEIANVKFSKIPIIAMGHLYMQGVSLSDSERDIQIGNQAGISVDSFKLGYDYFALGHIHKPQNLTPDKTIQYSGSPLSLSFSERKDVKRVIVFETQGSSVINIESIELQKYRQLARIQGTLQEIKNQILVFENTGILPAFLELHALEEQYDAQKIVDLIELSNSENNNYEILNYKIHFSEQAKQSLVQDRKEMINELKPIDVFKTKIEDQVEDKDQRKALESAFAELLNTWTEANA